MAGINEDLQQEIARIIRISDEREEFVTFDCGYVYFWPEGHRHGAYSPWMLRALADELDRRNAPWDAQIQSALGNTERQQP